jgi:hypothetical protein
MFASLLGTGALGGYFTDPAQMGRHASSIVLEYLQQPAAPASQSVVASQLTFDAVQLRRWKISEATLPPGSVVLNRELLGWRRYLWPLVGTSVLVARRARSSAPCSCSAAIAAEIEAPCGTARKSARQL